MIESERIIPKLYFNNFDLRNNVLKSNNVKKYKKLMI